MLELEEQESPTHQSCSKLEPSSEMCSLQRKNQQQVPSPSFRQCCSAQSWTLREEVSVLLLLLLLQEERPARHPSIPPMGYLPLAQM